MDIKPQNGVQYLTGIVQSLQKENKVLSEKVEEQQKEIKQLKGFVAYLQARNKDMVNINGWHMKTNKHLRERI